MYDILLPRLTETMEEGAIVEWQVEDGSLVRRGDVLAEIETDKASVGFESDRDGILQILAEAGNTVAVGSVIARLGDPGEQAIDTPEVAHRARDHSEVDVLGSGGAHVDSVAPATAPPVKASPVARRIAQSYGLDLREVEGTGTGGRIRREDVERAALARDSTHTMPGFVRGGDLDEAEQPSLSGEPLSEVAVFGRATRQTLTPTQTTIARRMAEAKATVPDFSLTVDAEMDEIVRLRESCKEQGATPPSITDFVVKATAFALVEQPLANGCFRDGQFELRSRVNVGIAVAVEAGLLVTPILDADRKSLHDISRESRMLAGRVREGTITPAELAGATFTVSNLGMFGVRRFAPIVVRGQAAILGVGSCERRYVRGDDGEPDERTYCELTLVSDHRILYGVDAARFCNRIAGLLSTPFALMVGRVE